MQFELRGVQSGQFQEYGGSVGLVPKFGGAAVSIKFRMLRFQNFDVGASDP